MDGDALKYQAFWCEENIWHLAQHPTTSADEALVLAVTGTLGQVACWQQKAAEEGEAVVWDYHVVLATKTVTCWQIWDLDTRLGMPVSARTWMDDTFPYPEFVLPEFHPRFAVFDTASYVKGLNSDRSHMRTDTETWLKTPPSWPAIRGDGLGLQEILRLARAGLHLHELRARLM